MHFDLADLGILQRTKSAIRERKCYAEFEISMKELSRPKWKGRSTEGGKGGSGHPSCRVSLKLQGQFFAHSTPQYLLAILNSRK